jgi:hypothetical protein
MHINLSRFYGKYNVKPSGKNKSFSVGIKANVYGIKAFAVEDNLPIIPSYRTRKEV